MPDKSEKNICIEDIMDEIRAEIKEKGYNSSMLSFEDVKCDTSLNDHTVVGKDMYAKNLQYVNLNYGVQPYKQLFGRRPVVIFRKILRKLIKFYIEPIVEDQNALNVRFVQLFNYIDGNVKPVDDAVNLNTLSKQIDDLELRMKSASSYTENLEKRIALLEKENEELKSRISISEAL